MDLYAYLIQRYDLTHEAAFDAFELGVDEQGAQYIAQWNLGAPQPTAQEIADAELPMAKLEKRDELILAADADYRGIFTRDGRYVELEKDYIFIRAIMGLALSAGQRAQRDSMRAVIEKLQQKLQQANSATSVAEVEAVSWQ